MVYSITRKLVAIVLLLLAHKVYSAPLDALLSADRFHRAGAGDIELAFDAMNTTLDVFHLRPTSYEGTNTGNYFGTNLMASYALTSDLSFDARLWNRKKIG